jgi:hypothetical protein
MRNLLLFVYIFNILLLSPAIFASDPIKVLGIGAVLPVNTPIVHWCADEPLAIADIIPTRFGGATYDPEESQRFIRKYFPRRLDRTTVDVVLFSAGDVVYLTTSQIAGIMAGVESGVGAIADCGGTSVIQQSIDSWVASGIGTIFPNDVEGVLSTKYSEFSGTYPGYFLKGVPYTIEVEAGVPGNPFAPFVAVGIEKVRGFAGRNMISRSGSRTLASMSGNYGFIKHAPPFSLSWDYGSGKSTVVCEWFGHPFWSDYGDLEQQSENPYAEELFVNILLDVTGRPIFEDVIVIHSVKENFKEYRIRKGNLISVIDFAYNFGANLVEIEDEIDRMEEEKRRADEEYLQGNYEESSTIISDAVADLQAAFDRTIVLKNRALFSVYISEWLAVTGTLVISGSVVYQIMIRRRIYREVGTTSTSRQ